MQGIATPPLVALMSLVGPMLIAELAVAQPAGLPASCSQLVIEPHQEVLIERLLTAQPLSGMMPVRTGDIRIQAAAIEATYVLGEGHDTDTTRYRLRPGRRDDVTTEGVSTKVGRLVLERLSPCVGEGDAKTMLCADRNGRAALAALHMQLKARLDSGTSDLSWRCLDGADKSGRVSGTGRKLADIRHAVGPDPAQAGRSLDALLQAVAKDDMRARERLEVAILHHELARPAGVRPWLDLTLQAEPSTDPASVEANAVALAMSGKQAEAAAALATCSDKTPPCSATATATLLERLDRAKLALSLLDETMPETGQPAPGHYLTRIRIAARHPKAGGLPEAARWLKSALKAWPEDVPLRTQGASLAAEQGHFGEAMDHAALIYKLAPENPATFELLAGWMRRLSEAATTEPQARAALQGRFDALSKRLTQPDASIMDRYLGALAALHTNNPGRAVELLGPVKGAHAKHVQVAIHLALAHLRLGQGELALAEADRAIKLEPKHPEAWYGLAQVRVEQDRPGAITALRRYLELSRLSPEHSPEVDKAIERDLGLLQAGELPAGWQPAAQPRAGMGGAAVSTGVQAPVPANEPLKLPAPPGALVMLAALALLGGLYWWWRRKT